MTPGTPSTAGIPCSRATIAACDSTPPVSVTKPAARANSGVHAGSVDPHTTMSPGITRVKSAGPRSTRAGPVAAPGLPGTPVNVVPAVVVPAVVVPAVVVPAAFAAVAGVAVG